MTADRADAPERPDLAGLLLEHYTVSETRCACGVLLTRSFRLHVHLADLIKAAGWVHRDDVAADPTLAGFVRVAGKDYRGSASFSPHRYYECDGECDCPPLWCVPDAPVRGFEASRPPAPSAGEPSCQRCGHCRSDHDEANRYEHAPTACMADWPTSAGDGTGPDGCFCPEWMDEAS